MTDPIASVETDSDVSRKLLESTRAIPWKIDWATNDDLPLQFVEEVDMRLHRTKQTGRNRVVAGR